jgi:hypothetical protein
VHATGWDLFISYRRRDAALLARWLARRLRRFRLPAQVLAGVSPAARALHERRPRIFLDTNFERTSPDFLEHKVYPALDASARLLVISTPAAFQPAIDRWRQKQKNWLCLEVERFVGPGPLSESRPIDLVLGPSAPEDRFPGRLDDNERWDWVDLRNFSVLRSSGLTGQLDGAIVKLVASLYGVDDHLQEALRQEEQKRRNQRLLVGGIGAALIAVVMSALAVYALDRQVQSNRATAAALSYLVASREALADALATSAERARVTGDELGSMRLLAEAKRTAVTARSSPS